MSDELKRVGLIFTQEGAVDFKKSLQEINLEMNKNYNQFKLTQAQWDNSTKSVEKLKAQQEYLTNAYEIQEDKVKTLRMQLSELENAENKNVSAIKKKRNELTSAEAKLANYKNRIKEVESQLTNTGKKIEEFGEKIQKNGEKVEKAGNKLSAFSAATATALVGASKSAIDFESAFTGVEKTVDGTPEQLEKIKQGIRDMAKEIPSSTTEISAVAEAAGQLGIETENILSFSKAMIDLGNSTNLTADEAASQLAKFANIMGMSQSDFDKLGSSIVDLGNNFATTEADIVDMAMRLAGAGKQVGLSEGQVLGLATALSSVGIEAEMGGSAISKAMVKMQNAVDLGGGKLQTILKKAGMSLHEMELMAANDSMGFKELASSLDMTSTELKQMITAGTNLEDFAKVSGMTVEQFKKAWKEDAAGALSAFIQGLGHAEDKGESAITMLSEMGLTEVRLRDSLLRSANAGDLFNNAIKTGTTAWEENTALTNEANKRYDTLKSKLQIAMNKFKDLAITFGNKLLPVVDKGIEKIEGLSKWVENLNDDQVEWILKTAGVVVAIGPLIKILGKTTTVTGKTVKGIGTFIQAIGVMKGNVTTSSTAVNGLAGVMSKMISPIGLTTTAVLAVAGAWLYFSNKSKEAQQYTNDLVNEIKDAKQAQDDYNKSIDDSTNSELSQMARIQDLKGELDLIVDENGKVKEGYEKRASFILNELNEALGTEYEMNGNIINSYKDISGEIDKLIEKKKADIVLAGEAKKWEKAYNDQQDAIIEQEKAYSALKDCASSMGDDLNTFLSNIEQANKDWDNFLNHGGEHTKLMEKYNKAVIDNANKIIDGYNTAEERVKTNQEAMNSYDEKLVAYTNGAYDEVVNTVKTATDDWTDYSLQKLKETINAQGKELEDYTHSYDTTNATLAAKNKEAAESNLKSLTDELVKRTNVVHDLSQDEINAWKALAEQSYDAYQAGLAQMEPTMRQKIVDVTGIIYQKTPDVSAATEVMSKEILARLDNDEAFRNEALNSMYGYLNGLSNSDLRSLLTAAGIQDVNKVMEGIRAGNLAEEEGKKILTSLNNGLSSGAFQGSLFKTASNIAQGIANRLSVKFNVSGLNNVFKTVTGFLPGFKLGLDYVPKDNYVARLHKGERVLTAEENKEYTEAEEEAKRRGNSGSTNVSIMDYSQIANAMISANARIELLLTKILEQGRRQKIVLDTGVLVGETVEQIDDELGRLSTKKERGS